MGLGRATIAMLLNESARAPFRGAILTLGRQHVYMTADEVQQSAEQQRATLTPTTVEPHRESSLADQGFISDDSLYRRLGFETSLRVDASRYEECEEVLDLNSPTTPPHLENGFDVVLDSGTLEHVFDVPAVLRHCSRMVRPGGRIIHMSPSSNCVEHGFYSVSPTLYADYYRANGFDLNRIWLCRVCTELQRGHLDVYDYLNAPDRFIPLGALDRRIWFTFMVGTKRENVAPVVPQQSLYMTTWATSRGDGGRQVEPPESKAGQILTLIGDRPTLRKFAQRGIDRWRRLVNAIRSWRGTPTYPSVGRF